MAIAEKTLIPIATHEEGIKLTLNKLEAHFLYAIMNCIGGSPTTSYRGIANEIDDLISTTISIDEHLYDKILNSREKDTSSIYFKNDTLKNG